jgi:adenylate cyclase
MKKIFFNHLIERHRDKLASQIVDTVEQTYSIKEFDEKELNSKIVELLNNIIKSESITESRDVTILLSDLRGFTAMSENYDPLDVIQLLNRYFTKINEIIVTRYGGTIDKIMGDSVMVLFGVPESKSDDVERALNCALEMQIAMDEINETNESMNIPNLFMGIGINTGKVVAGKIGSDLHSEYTVIGDEVNLASRIEAYSLRGQILISNNVFNRTKDFIETAEPTNVFVKGKKNPVKLFELLAVKKPVSRSVPRREFRNSPRIEVKMSFTYQKLSGKNILPEKHKGTILDISYNGILAIIEESIDVFSEIKFPLTLSMMDEESSDIYAKILKVFKVEGQHRACIEFTSIQPNATEAIKVFIERIIQGV